MVLPLASSWPALAMSGLLSGRHWFNDGHPCLICINCLCCINERKQEFIKQTIQTFCIHVLWIFIAWQKLVQVFKVTHRGREISRISIESITTTSELQIIVISLTICLWRNYLLTGASAWVAINLIWVFLQCAAKLYGCLSNVKSIELSPKTFLTFRLSNFESNIQNPAQNLWIIFEGTWEISEQQTKFRHGKPNMIHLKSFKNCLVAYKILQNSCARSIGAGMEL